MMRGSDRLSAQSPVCPKRWVIRGVFLQFYMAVLSKRQLDPTLRTFLSVVLFAGCFFVFFGCWLCFGVVYSMYSKYLLYVS